MIHLFIVESVIRLHAEVLWISPRALQTMTTMTSIMVALRATICL